MIGSTIAAIIACIAMLNQCLAFLPFAPYRINRFRSIVKSSFPTADISLTTDGGLMKQVIRRGDGMIGRPHLGDSVKIAYKISRMDNSIIDEVRPDAKSLFSFVVGSSPTKVNVGLDLSIQSMMESEISKFIVAPDYLQGIENVCPAVSSEESLIFEINLIAIVPSIMRSFKSVGKDEDIAPQIMQEVMDKYHSKNMMATFNRPTYPIPLINDSNIGVYDRTVHNDTNSLFSPDVKPNGSVEFFDDTKHKLDPSRRILGEGQNHTWEENVTQIDISVPIGDTPVTKDQMEIVIEPKFISVRKDGELLLSGVLHGKILPSQSAWSFADPDPTQKFKGYRVVLGLEKSHLSSDLWATVLDREYMRALAEQKQ